MAQWTFQKTKKVHWVLPVAHLAKITSKELLLIGFVLPLLWAGSEAPLASLGTLLCSVSLALMERRSKGWITEGFCAAIAQLLTLVELCKLVMLSCRPY